MASSPDDRSSSTELEQAQTQTIERTDAPTQAEAIPATLVATTEPQHDVVGLEREIRRRQAVESTLRDSEARYRLLYDNNPSMYFTLTPEGAVVSVNEFGATQLGYQPAELIGQSILKVFKSEEHHAVLGQLVVCAASQLKVFQWEIQKVRKDGSTLWVKERAQAVTDEKGQILVLIVCEDITERRLTEDCIRESEERWRALFEHAGVGIAQLGLNGHFLRVNPRLCETLGYSSKTLLQRTLQDFTHPDDVPLHHQYLDELVAGKRPSFSMEKRYRRSDDVWVWVDLTVSLMRNASQAPAYFIAVVQNIDDRKRAEEALQESETRFRQIAETIEEVVWTADPANGNTLYISPAYERVWGRTCASLYENPESFFDSIHPDDRGRVLAAIAELGSGLPFDQEYRIIRPDGTIRWVWDRGFPVRDPGTGHLTHYVGVALDITARRQAEEALRVSESAIRELHDITSTRAVPFDQQIRELLDLGRRRFQLPIAAFTTVKGEQLELTAVRSDRPIPKEGTLLPRCSLCSQTLEINGSVAIEHASKWDWKDGHPCPPLQCESYLGTSLSIGGQRVGTICFMGDEPYRGRFSEADRDFLLLMARWITRELERRKSETDLRNSEEGFRLMFECAPVGMVIVNQDKTLRKINPAFQRIIGYHEEEIVGNTYAFYTHPDDLEVNVLVTEQFLRGEIPGYTLEKRYLRKDGGVIWVNVNVSPLRLPGEPNRLLLAIVEDITDRKRAESALGFTQFAVDHAGELIFWIDQDARILYVNDAAAQRLGYSREELCRMTVADIDPNYPLDVWPQHWEELRLHKKLRFESCHRTKSGELYPAEVLATYVNFEGQEYNFAFARDISERKIAEEALRASEERFSKAFRSSPYPIIVTDLETGRCLEVNDASLQVFGFERHEVIGQSTLTLGLWPNSAERQKFIERLSVEGSLRNLDMIFHTRDHTTRRFLVSCELIELNRIKCMVAVGTDITEQKRAEEALRQSEHAVRQAFEERERLSQDLHDNLLQSLYAIGMGLELTKHRIERISQTNAKRLLDSVHQLNAVIREVRGFIPRMQPPLKTEKKTLADALRALTDSFISTGAGEIALNIDDAAAMQLSPEQSTHVLAIAKEALSNSIRHTKAAKRMVTLRRQRRTIYLEIADNGRGFSLARRRSLGMGLKNMRARTHKLQGRIVITSAPNKGTTVTLSIPSS